MGDMPNKSAIFLHDQRNGRVFTAKRLVKMKHGYLTLAAVVSLLFFSQVRALNADFKDCSGKLTPGDLQRCEDMFARKVEAGSRTSQLPGGWRLVKTPDPSGGPDAVSVLHAADTTKSDLNFAGPLRPSRYRDASDLARPPAPWIAIRCPGKKRLHRNPVRSQGFAARGGVVAAAGRHCFGRRSMAVGSRTLG